MKLLLALLLCAGAARAEDKKPDDRPLRVRASHQVDVIAPGERVETVLDRMRAAPPSPAPAEIKPLERNVRGVEHQRSAHPAPPPGPPPGPIPVERRR